MTSTGCGVLIMARTHEARVRRDGKDTREWRRPPTGRVGCGAVLARMALDAALETSFGRRPTRLVARLQCCMCPPRAGAVRVLCWRGGGGAWIAPIGGAASGETPLEASRETARLRRVCAGGKARMLGVYLREEKGRIGVALREGVLRTQQQKPRATRLKCVPPLCHN